MANLIRLRRSAVAGKAPATADLALGELAVNTTDGKLYLKKSDGGEVIVEVGAVTTVAGRTGQVTLTKSDVGLSSVDNTSDTAKPVSAAAQVALNGKASSVHSHVIADVSGLQTSLDVKAPLASPALTGTPTAPTQAQGRAVVRLPLHPHRGGRRLEHLQSLYQHHDHDVGRKLRGQRNGRLLRSEVGWLTISRRSPMPERGR